MLLPTLAAAQTGPKVQPRPHEPPTVKLLEPGKAPLAPLRYALKAGEQSITITADGAMEVTRSSGSTRLPFPTLTLPIALLPVSKGISFEWQKPTFTTVPEDHQTGHIMTALEKSRGLLQVADDGRGVIANILLTPGPSDKGTQGAMETRSILATEMGKGILALLEVPLPAEPIGVGGRWQVERIAVRGIVTLRQFTTFTLIKREGTRLELSYRVGGVWDPSSGLKEEEVKLAVSGEGRCTVDLKLPMPTALADEVTVKATLTAADGQQTFQSTRVGTRVESR